MGAWSTLARKWGGGPRGGGTGVAKTRPDPGVAPAPAPVPWAHLRDPNLGEARVAHYFPAVPSCGPFSFGSGRGLGTTSVPKPEGSYGFVCRAGQNSPYSPLVWPELLL